MIVLHDQERIGRRWSDVIFIGTNAVFLGVAAIFSNHAEDDLTSQWTVTAMCLLAKMNSAASFCVVYAHTVEIFPTSIRHYLHLINKTTKRLIRDNQSLSLTHSGMWEWGLRGSYATSSASLAHILSRWGGLTKPYLTSVCLFCHCAAASPLPFCQRHWQFHYRKL